MKYSPKTDKKLPSNQTFGWTFASVLAAGAIYALVKDHTVLAISLAAASVVFIVLTLVTPKWLTLLNRLWFEVGLLLGKIVSPIVLGILFLSVITPVAVLARLCGRDELRLKKRDVQSYWIERDPPGPEAESFKNQF